MQGRLLLDVIVAQRPSIFQLLASENQSLLFRRDSFFILNLRLYVLNSIIRLHIQSDRLSGQSLHENLHGTTSQTQHQVQGRLLLDVVITQRPSIFQLFTSEDQPLLLRRDTFFILNLRLYILDGIIGFHIQCNSFTREGLHKDLHGHCKWK